MRYAAVLLMTSAMAMASAQTPTAPAAPATPATPAPQAKPSRAPRAKTYVVRDDGVHSGMGMGYGAGVGKPYLGVDITDVTSDRVSALKLKDEHGVEITMVDADAPAGKAGLREHDVILDYNGQRVESEEQFRRMLRETPAGREVTLGISRDGQPMQIKLKLAERKNYTTTFVMPNITIPKMEIGPIEIPDIPEPPDMSGFDVRVFTTSTSAGASIEALTPQLGEFFGVKNGEGVLVRSVEKGSPAEQGGMKAGDVIVKVDGQKISDRGDWRSALRRKSGKVTVSVMRERREQTLTLTLPERSRGAVVPQGWYSDDDDVIILDPAAMTQVIDATRLAKLNVERNMPAIRQAVRVNTFEAMKHAEEVQKEVQKNLEKSMKELQKSLRELDE